MPEKAVTVEALYKEKPADFITISNPETGATAAGKISDGAKLIVVPKPSESHTDMRDALTGNTIIGTYEVTIENGSFTGSLVLSFDVGEEYNGKTVIVKHKLASGKIETHEAVCVNGKVTITVTELSPFMLAVKKETVTQEPSQPAPETDAAQTDVPQTGDNMNVLLLVELILIAAAMMVAIILWRRKQHQS